MIRTKYLLVALIACMVLIVTAGSFGASKQTGPMTLSENGEMFFVPAQDSYAIISQDPTDTSRTRSAFIEKIKTDVRENPLPSSVEEPATNTAVAESVVVETDTTIDVVPEPVLMPSTSSATTSDAIEITPASTSTPAV